MGLINLIENCNAAYEIESLKCISFEYTSYYIDNGMSELNNFPRDEYFKVELQNHRIELIRNSQSEQERYNADDLRNIKSKVYFYLNSRGIGVMKN